MSSKFNGKLYKILFISVLFFLLIIGVSAVFLYSMTSPASSKSDEFSYRIKIPAGTATNAVADELYNKKLIKSKKLFYAAVRFSFVRFMLTGNAGDFTLKSGVYKIYSTMNLAEILKTVSSGRQEYIRVVLPEGLTISKIASKLDDAGVCEKADFINAANDVELLAEYRIPSETFEGYLFPDTYFFTPFMSGKDVVKIMVENFFEHIKKIPAFMNMTPEKLNETVILASIVEREYRIDDEAPLIASVFKNRLKKNIGLYSCATVEYIITEIEGRPHPDVIKYSDLALDNRYNTYKWAGLPPGAISNPGMIALEACANTPKTDYYFFRLTDGASGKHVFSKNFSAHIKEGDVFTTKKSKS